MGFAVRAIRRSGGGHLFDWLSDNVETFPDRKNFSNAFGMIAASDPRKGLLLPCMPMRNAAS